MSSLRNILNPDDDGRRRSVKLVLNMEPHASTSQLPSSPTSDSSANDITNDTSSHDHTPHPDCPDTLACLPDTDGRPQHTLPVILRCAILGAPRKRLTIREIYAAMENKYPYYKGAGPTWKQSVRHHLSLNRLFERQPRPVTDPGFGSYWTVNLTAPPGTKRPRKRGRSSKETELSALPAKKRGRPRKILPSTSVSAESVPTTSHDEDDDDERLIFEDDPEPGQVSEDDCESEDEPVHPLDRRSSLVGLSGYGSSRPMQSFALPPFSTMDEMSDSIIDRMQIELAGLRRQSADAVSVSLRLSDQLAQVQAESSRVKTALKSVENMLAEESQKRREAEAVARDESKRRQTAEEALAAMMLKYTSSFGFEE